MARPHAASSEKQEASAGFVKGKKMSLLVCGPFEFRLPTRCCVSGSTRRTGGKREKAVFDYRRSDGRQTALLGARTGYGGGCREPFTGTSSNSVAGAPLRSSVSG